jgi:integrase/recombinase XerC
MELVRRIEKRDGDVLTIFTRSHPLAYEASIEFFVAHIRNPNTRNAYQRAANSFLTWASDNDIPSLGEIRPLHVADWVDGMGRVSSVSTVKQRLAGLSMWFDWLVVHHVMETNPASSVKSPRQVISKGKTPVLDPSEARQLVNAIDTSTAIGLRDRALIGLMLYSFARIGAALSMRVSDVFTQHRRLWVRLHEKGGKLHDMPCHHELELWLDEYIEGVDLRSNPEGHLFMTFSRETKKPSDRQLTKSNAYQMVQRRSKLAGLKTHISNHSFRATGITAYLVNHGTLETAARMANHASTRTTQLYDRRDDAIVQAEVERIRF